MMIYPPAPPRAAPDAELVRRFIAGNEAAFELLVWRYRGLVFDVCRRTLGHSHDAEDAAQAAFLVFAKKAESVRADHLAGWLARVAHRCALRVRGRRPAFTELPDVPAPPRPAVPLDGVLDAELDRLPEKYRTPIVLCYLHGLSYAEASEQLNCPTGTLCGWLTRGKELLRKRLAQRGIAVPVGVLAVYLSELGRTASASHRLVRTITTAALSFVAGEARPDPAAAIAHGVLQMMTLKRTAASGLLGFLTMVVALAALSAGDPRKADESKVLAAEPEKPVTIERTIGQEPKYQGKPTYCLLVFDAGAKHRAWLVHDGDTLYVDKNGNGDLTDGGEKVAAKKQKGDEEGDQEFEVGDVTVGGTTHKGLTVSTGRLDRLVANNFLATIAPIEPTLKTDKTAVVYALQVESERPGVKGAGAGGRVQYRVGPFDANGVLRFAPTTADAPVIHLGGRFELWSQFGEQILRTGQDSCLRMVVGAPGFGPGTLASIPYDNTIPDDAHPVAEITFPARPGEKPRTQAVPMNFRTCGYSIDARFKCGEETGSATVKFHFGAWKEGNVAPTTHSMAIQPPPKLTGPKAEPVSERLVATLPHPVKEAIPLVHYSPDGKRLLVAGDMSSGVVQLWDVDGRKELLQIAGPKRVRGSKDPSFLAEEYALLSPDGKTLYVPTRGENVARVERGGKKADLIENLGRVRRWDLTTKKELDPYSPPTGWGNLMADLSPGGRFLYSIEHKDHLRDGEREARLVIWDTTTGERVALLKGNYGNLPVFLPGDRGIATTQLDKEGEVTVRVHSLPDGKEVVSKTHPCPAGRAARFVGASSDGKLLAVNLGGKKGENTTTLFLDTESLEETARWTAPANPTGFGYTPGRFTPNGQRFLTIDGENTLHIWDVAAKKVARTVKLDQSGWRSVVSGDGRWFATTWTPPDPNKFANEAKLDPESLPQPRGVLVDLNDPNSKPVTLVAPRGIAWGMALRPDGKQLALGGSGGVHLFDLTTLGGK
ncbi:sigma-70 family RNA polymerase sigma factor [Gemmata sp. G18]|uniref:Sigma-70 family RNA polymerase sigma factor n=1 Tax=Gemmata palustris TaxID=2822762 RepID=A0ABS5BRX6_9BACT|nr:sigma-70 family RNA polymerase sigma factor [Gemmata palustris]MBP3955618.1 sigma-70 family RNA polymerase sigma factor [Gemmata palustris]